MSHGGDVWRDRAPGDWLDFSANIRPGGPPEWVRRALAEGIGAAAYYPDPRMERERAALGAYLNLDPDWVLPTAGGISAIDLATRLSPEGMRVFAPCFGEYAQLASINGVPFREIALLTGRHALGRPSRILREEDAAGRSVWLCNPLNPVGVAFPADEIAALLEIVEAANSWLVVDEAFVHCCPEHTAIPLLAAHPRLAITGSLTKALGIPGVRAGYLCAHPDALRRLAGRQRTWEVSCFAGAAMRALPAHADELRAEAALNAVRREALRRELESLGAYVYPSEANFLLADFGVEVAPVAARLKEDGILVRECMDFSGIDDGRHLRLAVKDEAANGRLIDALKEALACGANR